MSENLDDVGAACNRLLILATRDPAETHDEFIAWWRAHAEVAAEMPGITSYRVFSVSRPLRGREDWDGFALLEFEDGVDAEDRLLRSEEGLKAMEGARGRGGRRLILLVDEAHVVR